MFDPFLAAGRLPKLAERAMRDAVVARLGARRSLVDDALTRFERFVEHLSADGIRPSVLFAERDRMVRELERFARSRLARRLFSVARRDVVATGREARPFDAIVRGRNGELYAVVVRRLPAQGRRLEALRSIRNALRVFSAPIRGAIVYDFTAATMRSLSAEAAAQSVHRDLRAGGQGKLGEDMRNMILDRLVAEAKIGADLLVG